MSIKTVLFDLDGTLLPMDQKEFTEGYFKFLAAKMAPYGYAPEHLIKSVWTGTYAMVKNNGERTNEEVFWKKFCQIYGDKVLEHKEIFEEFYSVDFHKAKAFCGFNPNAVKAVDHIKDKGLRVALATNPLFPAVATESRIRWAGFSPEDFEIYTTFENSRFCKPNTQYYSEIVDKLGVNAKECLMVGNDVTEDMIAENIGMKVFLLTDCIINKDNEDISKYPHGNFLDLIKFIDQNI